MRPSRTTFPRLAAALVTLCAGATVPAGAQPGGPRTPNDTLRSPVVAADGRVTFQLYAPKATEVRLRSEGPAPFADKAMTRNDAGVWTLTTDPVAADLYIYWYDVDGLTVADPRNPRTRLNMSTVRSFLDVPGAAAEFHADRAVPHGTVAQVWYRSASLGAPRRMHVYTPPGYGAGTAGYPVLYLLHGGGDTDDAWPTVGRAGFILDNLIAAGKARPMIVVMPAGHTPRPRGAAGATPSRDPFADDLLKDVMPYVERNYRVLQGRQHRALAGLSMGGFQTLDIGLTNLDRFSQLGVFSSGWFGESGPATFERNNPTVLTDPKINDRIKLFWIATGKEDFVLPSTKATLALLDRHKVRYAYKETEGGHTWPNWRAYLAEFAPLLFR
jgi:enterochelin esterase family protein